MGESTAIDPYIREIVHDARVSPTAVRLYLILRDGRTLEAAATALGRSTHWLKRYERQLRDLGYIELHHVLLGGNQRESRYVFREPKPVRDCELI